MERLLRRNDTEQLSLVIRQALFGVFIGDERSALRFYRCCNPNRGLPGFDRHGPQQQGRSCEARTRFVTCEPSGRSQGFDFDQCLLLGNDAR